MRSLGQKHYGTVQSTSAISNPRSRAYWPRLETEEYSRVHHQASGETTSEHRRMQEYGAQSASRPARLGAAPVTSRSPSPRPFQCPKRLGKRTSNRRPSPICPHSVGSTLKLRSPRSMSGRALPNHPSRARTFSPYPCVPGLQLRHQDTNEALEQP
jgi:hypothetical protein